jgi:hypothetical protein
MASVSDLVERIRAGGANVVLDRGHLRLVNGKKLAPEALAYIKRNGKLIAEWLEQEGAFEERAAIIEHDGGASRPVAEGLARLLLARPPKDVDPADWTWFVGKAAHILDGAAAREGA